MLTDYDKYFNGSIKTPKSKRIKKLTCKQMIEKLMNKIGYYKNKNGDFILHG